MTTLDRWRAQDPFVASPTKIVNVVAHMYELDPDDLTGPSRTKNLVRARHIACWLLRDLAGLSFPVIAREMGRTDHTTAMHAVGKIDKARKGDDGLALELALLRLLIEDDGQQRLAV